MLVSLDTYEFITASFKLLDHLLLLRNLETQRLVRLHLLFKCGMCFIDLLSDVLYLALEMAIGCLDVLNVHELLGYVCLEGGDVCMNAGG